MSHIEQTCASSVQRREYDLFEKYINLFWEQLIPATLAKVHSFQWRIYNIASACFYMLYSYVRVWSITQNSTKRILNELMGNTLFSLHIPRQLVSLIPLYLSFALNALLKLEGPQQTTNRNKHVLMAIIKEAIPSICSQPKFFSKLSSMNQSMSYCVLYVKFHVCMSIFWCCCFSMFISLRSECMA